MGQQGCAYMGEGGECKEFGGMNCARNLQHSVVFWLFEVEQRPDFVLHGAEPLRLSESFLDGRLSDSRQRRRALRRY